MGKLKAASTSTLVPQAIKKESLFNESIEGTRQPSTTFASMPAAQTTKKESFSGECNSARTCEIHVIHVKKPSTTTIETKILWGLKAS
jgi:hypothetical protein